jgi:DNA polymerase III subunit epsilon
MRQVVLDTETTGIDPKQGHRIIEIGCVEMIGRKLTNRHFHVYINPDREVE